MRNAIGGAVLLLAGVVAGHSQAQGCGGSYVVQGGDSLTLIADRFYQDAGKWTAIHSANLDQIGEDPNNLRAGMNLRLRCIDGRPTGLAGGTVAPEAPLAAAKPLVVAPGNAATRRKINILTGGDFWPFTDKAMPGGGMLTEVVEAAMQAANPPQGFAIHWVDDWSAHQEPLLSNALLDIGFPWFKPDCASDPETDQCANMLYSGSMFEVLMLLFVDRSRPMAFHSDADMQGKTLCRPAGYPTFMLDQRGRNWLKTGVITLKTPRSPAECLRLLVEGEVDGVVLNEFLGRGKIKELGLEARVGVADGQPISVEGTHMVVHRSHPDGPAFLAVFERGLAEIKADGRYQQIIEAHMSRVWAGF
jgi:polar amino acid transport system substrate-binding protein